MFQTLHNLHRELDVITYVRECCFIRCCLMKKKAKKQLKGIFIQNMKFKRGGIYVTFNNNFYFLLKLCSLHNVYLKNAPNDMRLENAAAKEKFRSEFPSK